MERIRCISAVCGGIGQRIDDLHLFDDRAGPSVRDDERQRIFVLRTHVNEMNVESIDLGHELRQGVQLRLALAPVVVCRPIARELLNRRELHALRCIRDRFPFGPLGRVDAPAQFGKFRFRNIHRMKRTNRILVSCLLAGLLCCTGCGHGVLLLNSLGFSWFVSVSAAGISARRVRNTVGRDGMPWPDEDTSLEFLRKSEESRI